MLNRSLFILAFMIGLAIIIGGWYFTVGFNPTERDHWMWLVQTIKQGQFFRPELFTPLYAGAIAALVLALVFVFLSLRPSATTLSGKQKAGALHGSARWANWRDIKKAELHKKQGAVVGGYKRFLFSRTRFLKHDGPEHILAFAPTRTGKGVSLIIPTLLEWGYSALILDIKGENYALTAGYRASLGHKVIRFEPAAQDGLGFSYNPLAEVGFGHDSEVADIQNIAAMIVDSGGQSAGKDQF